MSQAIARQSDICALPVDAERDPTAGSVPDDHVDSRELARRMLALLAGCVTTSQVVPMGKDSYMLNATSRGGLNAGKESIEASKAANAYCDAMGKRMIIRRMDTSGAAGWTPVTTNFVFSCVAEDDPECQRPNLKHDPTTIIEDQRH